MMKHLKIWTRYVVPDLLIILVFVVLVTMLYGTNLNTSREVKRTYVSSSLENGMRDLEETILQVNGFSSAVTDNIDVMRLSLLSPDSRQGDYSQIRGVQSTISSLTAMNPCIDYLFLVLPNRMVFSNDGRIHRSVEDFYGTFLWYEDVPIQAWLERENSQYYFWSAQNVSVDGLKPTTYFTYNCRNILRPQQNLTILISEESMRERLLPIEDVDKLGLRIVLGKNRVLFDSVPRGAGGDVIRNWSASLNLTFEVFLPNGFYGEGLEDLRSDLAVFILVAVLLNVGLAVVSSIRNSRPVRRLNSALEDRGMGSDQNPVDRTLSLISQLDESRATICERYSKMQRVFSSLEFEYMIASGGGGEYIPQGVSMIGGKPHVLLLFRLEGADTLPPLLVRSQSGIPQEIYSLSNGTRVMLYACREGLRDNITQMVGTLNERLEAGRLVCAVSGQFHEISQIRFAYTEADFTLHRGCFSAAQTVFFEDLDASFNSPLLSISHYMELDAYLNSGNTDRILTFFDGLAGDLERFPLTRGELRQICSILRSILYHNAGDCRELLPDILRLPEDDNRADVRNMLPRFLTICLKIAEMENTRKRSHNDQLLEAVVDCIGAQYHNPNLSLTYLADHLKVSAKYLSDFIREQLGKNYTEYLQEVRMKKAANMLTTTSLSISSISQAVGYYSANTFYKSFRRYYNMSPSDYKEFAATHQQETLGLERHA